MAFTLHAGTPPLDPRLAQVLEYWLGAEQPTDASALARKQLWFTKDEAVDEEIRHRFGAVMQEALVNFDCRIASIRQGVNDNNDAMFEYL